MFAAAVRTQASQAQLADWMPLIEQRAFSGCYAQTELAHVGPPPYLSWPRPPPTCPCPELTRATGAVGGAGQGSNVAALMTTATFVPETDEFDMHTPCLEATKWWIGDLVRPVPCTTLLLRSRAD